MSKTQSAGALAAIEDEAELMMRARACKYLEIHSQQMASTPISQT
jgi:hypothetical protein